MNQVVLVIDAIMGRMNRVIPVIDAFMFVMATVRGLLSEASSATDPFRPGVCARERKRPRLIARLARRTVWMTASRLEPRYCGESAMKRMSQLLVVQ